MQREITIKSWGCNSKVSNQWWWTCNVIKICCWKTFSGRNSGINLDEYVQEDVPIYAVYPSGKHLSPKVRAFLDFLIETYGPVPYWDEAGDHNSDAAKRTVI